MKAEKIIDKYEIIQSKKAKVDFQNSIIFKKKEAIEKQKQINFSNLKKIKEKLNKNKNFYSNAI